MVNSKRVRKLQPGPSLNGPVIYWMSRDQRIRDNWALSYTLEIAENNDLSAMVVFTLADDLLEATWRQFDFMIKGLIIVEHKLNELNIPFFVLNGDPVYTLPRFIRQHKASQMVTDFDPLKAKRKWKKDILGRIQIAVDEVDTHNIVPCWVASDKEEYGAYTLRPKITKHLPEFMDEFPPLIPQRKRFQKSNNNWKALSNKLTTDRTVPPVNWITPGENAAISILRRFIAEGLPEYHQRRNDPNASAVSNLSPYIRFGHISAQRIALEILKAAPRSPETDAFLEELIIRKELSDNFCYYNPRYDDISGFREWARTSLDQHRNDHREVTYDTEQFEKSLTHDELWNAAQNQMVITGKMHGYMRMYWAKKILEWTSGPEIAYKTALYLNDKYEIDGRCANAYAGCAWSIGGTHDRAWSERSVYGKIRYMNRKGCERKFDVNGYISRYNHDNVPL